MNVVSSELFLIINFCELLYDVIYVSVVDCMWVCSNLYCYIVVNDIFGEIIQFEFLNENGVV